MLFVGKIGFRSLVVPAALGFFFSAAIAVFAGEFARKWLPNLLLILASTTIFLVIGDLVLRYALADSFYYRPVERFLAPNLEMPDRLIHYMKNKSWEGNTYGDMIAMSGKFEYQEMRHVKVETDELGFRNMPHQADKPSKYILLGDSFGLGVGSHQDSILSSFLEASSGEQVYNLSFPGYPYQGLLNLAIHLDRIELTEDPVIIWLLFTGNDLPFPHRDPAREKLVSALTNGNLDQHLEKNVFNRTKVRIEAWFKRSAYRKIRAQLRFRKTLETTGNPDIHVANLPGGHPVLFHQTYIESALTSADSIRSLGDYKSYEDVFITAAKFCESKGVELKIISLPVKFEIYRWLFEKRVPGSTPYQPSGFSKVVKDICNENNIPFYDFAPFLDAYSSDLLENQNSITWWRDDTHFNAHGYRALHQFVRDSVLVD
ncbi:MAG: GDSL-type esterase/lipase family protein [Bacteroidota bacterium]